MRIRKLLSPWRGLEGHQSPQNQFALAPALSQRWLGSLPYPWVPAVEEVVVSCTQHEGVLLMRSLVSQLKNTVQYDSVCHFFGISLSIKRRAEVKQEPPQASSRALPLHAQFPSSLLPLPFSPSGPEL